MTEPVLKEQKRDILKSGLRHGYSSAVQVLLQTLVEFCKPPKLQLGHGLLLALAVVVAADFVGSGHDCGWNEERASVARVRGSMGSEDGGGRGRL